MRKPGPRPVPGVGRPIQVRLYTKDLQRVDNLVSRLEGALPRVAGTSRGAVVRELVRLSLDTFGKNTAVMLLARQKKQGRAPEVGEPELP